jgi:hypothetical protein
VSDKHILTPPLNTKQQWVGDFNVFYYAESKEEAEELFDKLTEAAEAIVCGVENIDDDHECPRMWTAGGSIKTEQQFENEADDDEVF